MLGFRPLSVGKRKAKSYNQAPTADRDVEDGDLNEKGYASDDYEAYMLPDLEITPGTASELVKLKFALDYASIRDQARQALRVDVSERLAAVKDKLSTQVSFDDELGCVRGQVLRSEVTGVFPHPSFLRIYVQVDAQLGIYLPCKG